MKIYIAATVGHNTANKDSAKDRAMTLADKARDALQSERDEALAHIEKLEGALNSLLACPAIADGDLSSGQWGCPESLGAEVLARQALSQSPATSQPKEGQ